MTAVFAEDALLGKIKASPLGCMDNLRQNDWFGFFWRLRFYRLPLQLFVLGQRLYGAAFHGAFVGQETNAGPVGRIDIGGEGSSVFQNAGNELMDQMRMGTAMTAALLEGQMGIDLVIGHFVGKPANDVRKQMGIIGDLNVFLIDLAAAVLVLPNQIPAEHHMFVAVELIPLKGLVFTIDIKAFAVTTGDMV